MEKEWDHAYDDEKEEEEEEEEEGEELQQPGYVAYVQCSFCTTILWVGVPCSKSFMRMVTVMCGHCTAFLSVCLPPTMPFYFPFTEEDNCGSDVQVLSKPKLCENRIDHHGPDEGEEADQEISTTPLTALPLVNKPPEKRQRAPSTYNRFIREEIRRIKARDPNISHKEAFSTAAKNWAHFPRI